MAITLYENFRAVFYAPFYLPHALGAYEAEGVDVRLTDSGGIDYRQSHREGGERDVYWGGPMRLMVNHDRDPDCPIVGFCEVVTRDPFFLVGAEPKPDFGIPDLADLRLGSVSEVPTPWMCLQDDVRRAGLDPATLTRVSDRSMAENAAALRRGDLDVVHLFQPFAEELIAGGAGHLWHAAAARGACSYTTFFALRPTIEEEAESLLRMTRAMYRTQKWLHAQPAAQVAAAVADFFPEVSPEILAACIDRYRDLDVWGRNPHLPKAGFDRLQAAMISGGLTGGPVAYERCVDMRFADAVIAEDPPSM